MVMLKSLFSLTKAYPSFSPLSSSCSLFSQNPLNLNLQCRFFKTNPNKRVLRRTGLIAIKKGMMSLWTAEGKHISVTALALDAPQIIGHRSLNKNGYFANLVGSGWKLNAEKKLSRADLGQFAVAGVPPKKHVVEFRVRDDKGLQPLGTILSPNWFTVGQKVDVRATTRGKGFAGVMKRWKFSGLPASHGVSVSHRAPGSIGQCQDIGRVIPGKKMAGRMGGKRATVQGLEIIDIDTKLNTLLVKGAIPGPKESYVIVQDSFKTVRPVLTTKL